MCGNIFYYVRKPNEKRLYYIKQFNSIESRGQTDQFLKVH